MDSALTQSRESFTVHLSLLEALNPVLAQQLKNSPLPSRCTPSQTKKGEVNLSIHNETEGFELHNPEGAQNESRQLIEQLDLNNVDVLYFYGIGLGYPYEAALAWLNEKEDRYLIFIEDDLEVLYFFLHTYLAGKLLRDWRVDICSSDCSSFRTLTEDYILRSFSIAALPSYHSHKMKKLAALQDALLLGIKEKAIRSQELAAFGAAFYGNFYQNLLHLPDSYQGAKLSQCFQGIPAIICGAGASLINHLPQLKSLNQRALLFAPGSSLNILSYHGIRPDFGINIDPTPETFHRQIMNRAYDIPIFYRHRIYWEALKSIHGPRLWIPGATFYTAAGWIEKQLGIPTVHFEGGYNVVFTALEIAHFMGCNPIIFIGMDLSFQPGSHYAEGVERHPLFPEKTEIKTHLGDPIPVHDIHNQSVCSYWPWIAESQLIGMYAYEHPELTILNASEQGIGFFSIPNDSLQNILNRQLIQTYDLDQKVHNAIQDSGKVPITQKAIIDSLKRLLQSFRKCEKYCSLILSNLNASASANENKCKSLEHLLHQESAYQAVIAQFDTFYLQYLRKPLRNLYFENNPAIHLQKKLSYLQERHHFLRQLIRDQIATISNAIKESTKESSHPIKKFQKPILPQGEIRKTFYYPSGAIFSQTIVNPCSEDESILSFYEDGTLKTCLNYHKGLLSGTTSLYYPSGKPKRILNFLHGLREGTEKSWHENGQQFTEVEYHQNKALHARCWSPDGKLLKDLYE